MSYRAPGMGVAIPAFRGARRVNARPTAMQRLMGLMGLGDDASAAQKARWNAEAQACKQFANEGACLSRLARRGIPITIESAWGTAGLGRDCSQFANAGACWSREARRGRPITVQGPFGGFGQVPYAVTPGATMGHDSTRRPSGSMVTVDGDWAQRAANALLALNGGSGGTRITVDGNVGPLTLAQLTTWSRQYAGGGPVTGNPSGRNGRVSMPLALETRAATTPAVPNPPAARSSTRTSTTAARSTTTTPSTGKPPGAADAPPDATGTVGVAPDGQLTLTEDSGTPTWLVPALVIGGVAAAGSIGLVMWGRSRSAPRPVRAASAAVMANFGGKHGSRRRGKRLKKGRR